jgi:putative GTP pyrophosphokinase
MPELHERVGAAAADKVLEEFHRKKDRFSDLSQITKGLVERILEQEGIPVQSVQARVKRPEKLRSKYTNPGKDYKCLSDMPDVVGLRVITYYSDEIDRVAAILRREFGIHFEDDKRLSKPGEFGYSALHLDCNYSPTRLQQTEYKPFGAMKFEVQITTILGHAWAEMHHGPYDDKGSSPRDEQRAFHRLAAVLELADKEFLQARQDRERRQLNASVRVAAMAPQIEISPESIKAFIEETPIATELDNRFSPLMECEIERTVSPDYLERLVPRIKEAGFKSVQELEKSLRTAKDAISEYVTRCAPVWKKRQPRLVSRPVRRGMSIFQLCNFIFSIEGKERYLGHIKNLGLIVHPGLNLDEQVQIAQEVAAKYELKDWR